MKVADLVKLRNVLKANHAVRHTVQTQAEAEEMTERDRFGVVWQIGDEYYEMKCL